MHGMRYEDAAGALDLPLPSLPGPHQIDNAGIAVAAMRAAGLPVPAQRLAQRLGQREWPARLQRLRGRLAASLPAGVGALARRRPQCRRRRGAGRACWPAGRDRPLHIVVGMKQSKDAEVPAPAAAACDDAVGGRRTGPASGSAGGGRSSPRPVAWRGRARRSPTALKALPRASGPARVLICGSLYLAGEVLKADAG